MWLILRAITGRKEGRMTRWEYRVTTSAEELARLGREGWGITSVVVEPGSGTHTYYLARPAS